MSDGDKHLTRPDLPNPEDDKAGLRFLIDFAPLLVFFGTYYFAGIRTATAVLIAATLVSLVAARVFLGRISVTLIVTAVLVTFFGVLTFLLDDPSFIKMKPTAVNLLFAGVLGVGLYRGEHYLKLLLGEAFQLTQTGWRILTVRWIGLFIALAILNELVWRTMSESAWVNFKVFGILPITFVFAALQLPVIKRHAMTAQDETGNNSSQ